MTNIEGWIREYIPLHNTTYQHDGTTNFPKPGAQVIVARGGRVQARIESDTSITLADTAFWTHT
jgi:hypothetical protein